MSAVRKAVPSAVPSAVVPLRQSNEGIAPYKESTETADYLGANPVVLINGDDVNPAGAHYWGSTAGTESTSAEGFAPSIPGPSALPSRVEPLLFGGGVSASDSLVTQVQGEQAPNQDTLDQWTQTSQRLDNNGVQNTNNTGEIVSYPSPDGQTWKINDLGTQSQMQGFTMTAPGASPFNQQQSIELPQAPSNLPPNSGALNDSVYGAVYQGTGNTVVNVNDVPNTVTSAPAPVYAPLGWG
jgi:hypothetical protein